jgi:hypothetical protein
MAADFELLPLYGQQPVVRNRTLAALTFWGGQWINEVPPTEKPAADWVKKRILADRVTRNPSGYLDMSMNYYSQQDAIQVRMRDLMDGFPTEAERTEFTNTLMVPATQVVMGQIAEVDVTDSSVDQWYTDNGFNEPPAE